MNSNRVLAIRKILAIALLLVPLDNCIAQITSGTLHYSTETIYFFESERPNELAVPGDPIQSTLTVEFSPSYIRETTRIGDQTNILVKKRPATNQNLVALCSESTKSIKYYVSEDIPESGDVEQYPTQYYQDFYLELLEKPLKDTIVFQTDETKMIVGYLCKKTILKIPDGDQINVWTTNLLPGFEEFEKLHRDVKGTTVAQEFISKYFQFNMVLTSIDSVNKIDEKELIPFPEDLVLDLGTIYLSNGYFSKTTIQGFELPDFIDYSDLETTLKKINEILAQSKEMKTIGEYLEQDDVLKFQIETSARGKISDIHVTRYEEEINHELTTTLHQLQTKCIFKPITVNDKAVPFQFTIFYHFPY